MRKAIATAALICAALAAQIYAVQAPNAVATVAPTLRSGDVLATLNADGSRRYACTLGVVVTKKADNIHTHRRRWAITAGHCFNTETVGENVYTLNPKGGWSYVGQTAARRIEDFSRPGATGTEWNMGSATAVLLEPSVIVQSSTNYGRIVAATTDYKYGQSTCHLGITTGWQCGAVRVASSERGVARADVGEGDSGGPVFLVDRPGANPTEYRLTLIGIVVASAVGDDQAMRFNPWGNLARDITTAIGDGWQYYVYAGDS